MLSAETCKSNFGFNRGWKRSNRSPGQHMLPRTLCRRRKIHPDGWVPLAKYSNLRLAKLGYGLVSTVPTCATQGLYPTVLYRYNGKGVAVVAGRGASEVLWTADAQG